MRKTIYRSKLFRVEAFDIRVRGKRMVRDRIVGPNTVSMITLMDDGSILLERQYRHAIGRYLYEIPAGHIDPGETQREAATRELVEETGFMPRKLTKLFSAYVAPGGKTELQTCFIAENLVKSRARPDEDELLSLRKVTLKKALGMIRSNKIIDMKSVAALLFYAYMRKP